MNKIIKPVMLACSAGLMLTACATDRDEVSYSSTSDDSYASGSIQESSGAESSWQSDAEMKRSQQYSSQQRQSYSSGQTQTGNEVVIPLHEEQLNVGKRTVDAGTVTIRKVVTTETVNQPIELRKETLVIDREGGAKISGNQSQFQSSTTTSQSQSQGQISSTTSDDADIDADADASVSAQAGGAGVQAQADFDQEPAGATTSRSTTKQTSSQQSFNSNQSFDSGSSAGAFQEQTYTIQLKEEQPIVEKNVIQTGRVVARKNSEVQRQNVQREIRREDVRLDQGANSKNVQLRGDFNTSGNLNEPSGAATQSSQSYQSETQVTTQSSGAEVEAQADAEFDATQDGTFEDKETLDDINRGSNTRGGAEDLQRFDERSEPRE